MREMFQLLGEPGKEDPRFQPPIEAEQPVELNLDDTAELRLISEDLNENFKELTGHAQYSPLEQRLTTEAVLKMFRAKKRIDADISLMELSEYVKRALRGIQKKN